MADLADLDHTYGGDLGVSPSGDIAAVTKHDRTVQRIIRRLLTSPTGRGSAYPWQPRYGAGLGAKIGEALDVQAVGAIVRSQMLREPSVQRTPAPIIKVTPIAQGAAIDVTYTDLSGVRRPFNFDLVS